MLNSVHWRVARAIQGAVPTRQTSSSGRAKSPRIQVVLPEELCARLAELAEAESRTVSNMAKVLIQQGVERLEQQRTGLGTTPASAPGGASPSPGDPPAPVIPAASMPAGAPQPSAASVSSTDALRQALEQQEVARPQRRGPRRLRLQRPIV